LAIVNIIGNLMLNIDLQKDLITKYDNLEVKYIQAISALESKINNN